MVTAVAVIHPRFYLFRCPVDGQMHNRVSCCSVFVRPETILDIPDHLPRRLWTSLPFSISVTLTLNGAFFFRASLANLWQFGYVHGEHFWSLHDSSISTSLSLVSWGFVMGFFISNIFVIRVSKGFFLGTVLTNLWQLGYVHGEHFRSLHDNSTRRYLSSPFGVFCSCAVIILILSFSHSSASAMTTLRSLTGMSICSLGTWVLNSRVQFRCIRHL